MATHCLARSFTEGSLLRAAISAVTAAGSRLKERYSPDSDICSLRQIQSAVRANDAVSLAIMRDVLLKSRPGSHWAEDEFESGALPQGEWWVTDPVEGNVNHVHGMDDWCVTATLVRDNTPLLSVIHLPLSQRTYTAVRGEGAFLDGVALHPSVKSELNAAFVGTGQAQPGESQQTFRRIGESVTAMLGAALVLRVSQPTTLQLTQVAAGRMDVFWQFSQVRAGLLAGALLVAEAGGRVTDIHGAPWSLASQSILAAAPALHAAAIQVLARIE